MELSELVTALRQNISSLHKVLRKQVSLNFSYSMTEIETIGLLLRNAALLPTELAAHTRVKTQSMSQILKKLEEQGVIARVPSQDDKRKVYISLTPAGREMVEKTRYERDGWLKEMIEQKLTPEEITKLEQALPVFNKLLETK